MKVMLLGMENEFVDKSTSGIVKYTYSLYTEIGKIHNIEICKTEYKKLTTKIPWANNLAFYIESRFTDFKKYDILHNPNNNRIFTKPKGSKLVTTVHNVMSITEKMKPKDKSLMSKIVAANAQLSSYTGTKGFEFSLKSDQIIADTYHGKEEMLEYAQGYDKDKITVVPLGIDDKFMVDSIPEKKDEKIFKVGYLGSFNSYQNIPAAIKAVKSIESPSIRFEIWGSRSFESQLLEKDISADKRISFMSPVPQDRKVQLYESFDVFVHPGVYEGLPLLEAMSRGVPVIVFKSIKMDPEMKEYCLLADDERHMAQLINDIRTNGYNDRRRQESIKYARGFTWRRTAEQTVDVYKNVLSSR